MCTVQAHAQGILQMVVDPSFGNGLLLKFSLGCSHPTVPTVSMVLWVNVPLTTLSVWCVPGGGLWQAHHVCHIIACGHACPATPSQAPDSKLILLMSLAMDVTRMLRWKENELSASLNQSLLINNFYDKFIFFLSVSILRAISEYLSTHLHDTKKITNNYSTRVRWTWSEKSSTRCLALSWLYNHFISTKPE